ncbi:MAG: serine hydrolase domain-containing protein [bacterium]
MPRSARFLLVVPLLLAVARSADAQQSNAVAGGPAQRAMLVARLDSLAADYLAQTPAAGMTIAVVSRGDTLLLKGYGERDREKHLPVEAATVYRIGSITKQFTAAAVLRLVENGSVKLDDPMTTYLPQYPQWKGVTVRQLLNHTSGIHSYTSSDEWRKHWTDDLTPAALIGFVAKDTMDFAPGTKWSYNNTGYMLLGLLLEKVTKQPYAALMQRDFFGPLGMKSATYCPTKPTDAAYAVGYTRAAGDFKLAQPLSMTHPYAAGALCMSVPDFLRWQSALMGGRIVKPATLVMMTGPESLLSGAKTTYGMGLAPGTIGTHADIQHGGSINGFSTQQFWFPVDSLSIVTFVSTDGADPDWLVRNVASAVFGMPVTPKVAPRVPLAAADRTKYVGEYDITLADGRILPFKIFVEGEELMGQAEGQGKAPLRYLGDDTFGADFDPNVRLFFKVENGKVVSAKLRQNGATMNVSRRP